MIEAKWQGKKLVTFKNKNRGPKPDQITNILQDSKISDSKIKITFSIVETAKLLNVSRSVIDQAIRLNEIPHIHIRNRILITLPLLKMFIEGLYKKHNGCEVCDAKTARNGMNSSYKRTSQKNKVGRKPFDPWVEVRKNPNKVGWKPFDPSVEVRKGFA